MAVAAAAADVQLAPRLFTVAEYETMGRAGIFGPDERTELIEGQITAINPIGTGHMWAVSELLRIFVPRGDVRVTAQSPLQMSTMSTPEPALVVLLPTTPRTRKPTPADALLIIEVADSSVTYDRETKGPLYARAGIPEYWIVDLNGERVEQYREPSAIGYRSMRLFLRDEQIAPAFAPDLAVSVDAVLGPPVTDEGAASDTAAGASAEG